jgi:hypothetical protein
MSGFGSLRGPWCSSSDDSESKANLQKALEEINRQKEEAKKKAEAEAQAAKEELIAQHIRERSKK